MNRVTISLLTLVFFIGCGSSSSDNPTQQEENKTLDFNQTNAKYDLNNYLQVNSVVTYKLSNYVNNSGKKEYVETTKVETYPSQTNKRQSDVITITDENNIETGSIKILKNKFERISKDNNESVKFDVVRHFNIGKYITNSTMNQKISNATVKLNRLCKATSILESKIYSGRTYKDLLEIKCNTTSTLISNNALTTKANIEKSELIYMAKEKGIIYNKNESCTAVTNVTLGQENETKVCKKSIQEIISFIKS